MSELLNKPSNSMFTMIMVEYLRYELSAEGLGVIGEIILDEDFEKPGFSYRNDVVKGHFKEIGPAVRALYYSKLG